MLPLCFYAGPQLHDQELVLVFKKRIFDLHKGSFRPTNLKLIFSSCIPHLEDAT